MHERLPLLEVTGHVEEQYQRLFRYQDQKEISQVLIAAKTRHTSDPRLVSTGHSHTIKLETLQHART